ncbi:hypothetical protein BGX38DRAFT_156452 [Terfezia claveryi]|nr:hypothetical protein BGX38DRAFT_156452 [Terfezia claveryi]
MPSPAPPPPRLTHFLALTSSSLQDPTTTNFPLTLQRFRDLATSPTYNIPPAAIRPLGTMHLTLGVMALKNAEELVREEDTEELVPRLMILMEKGRKIQRIGKQAQSSSRKRLAFPTTGTVESFGSSPVMHLHLP